MRDSAETKKRRLEFLINEQQQKVREVEQMRSQLKVAGTRSVLRSLLGDSTTSQLKLQQMQNRIDDLYSQIQSNDFEIKTLRSAIATIDSLTPIDFTCPSCGASRKVSGEVAEGVKKQGFGLCKTCLKPFQVKIDEKTEKWSFEPTGEHLAACLHSPLLHIDLAYTESLMPNNVRENLITIMRRLEQSDKTSENTVLPQLERLYTTYPLQVGAILPVKGLERFLAPITVPCQKCGVGIPRTWQGNCPVCKYVNVQKKAREDAIQILKLRLVKGEISKEEYEERAR